MLVQRNAARRFESSRAHHASLAKRTRRCAEAHRRTASPELTCPGRQCHASSSHFELAPGAGDRVERVIAETSRSVACAQIRNVLLSEIESFRLREGDDLLGVAAAKNRERGTVVTHARNKPGPLIDLHLVFPMLVVSIGR